jgi:hypothetical protein
MPSGPMFDPCRRTVGNSAARNAWRQNRRSSWFMGFGWGGFRVAMARKILLAGATVKYFITRNRRKSARPSQRAVTEGLFRRTDARIYVSGCLIGSVVSQFPTGIEIEPDGG